VKFLILQKLLMICQYIIFIDQIRGENMDHQKLITLLQQAIEMVYSDEKSKSLVNSDINADIMDLLKSEEWPEAVPQYLICEDNEKDKLDRAEGILDLIGVQNIKGKKFLDFGCGEGHVSAQAFGIASKSIGYDFLPTGKFDWELDENFLLTSDFKKVVANAPFDFISLYDVLDHSENPVELLDQVKSICSKKTKIFVRCHPWIGRHASHLYRQINKAWIHVFFTEEEIRSMGYNMDFVFKTYFPMATQNKWFNDAGFKVVSSDTTKTVVEPFFKRSELKSRLPNEFKEFPEWQMCQAFNDYVIQIE
jgi:2-polyprenyl-3-methyl-5-hydroxy-6-metoxy-1,4-benzoquinol methylase